MSVARTLKVRCPFCSAVSPAPVYASLHVTRAPEVREAILERRFGKTTCSSCARTVLVEPTMLYTDFERYHWFATFPVAALVHRDDLAELSEASFRTHFEVAAPPIVKSWAPRFTRRVVFGLAALREKLVCADHALDDVVIELLKVQLLRDLAPRAFSWRTTVTLEGVTEAGGLVFSLVHPPSRDPIEVVREIEADREAYDRVSARAAGKNPFPGPVVDWRVMSAPTAPLPQPPQGWEPPWASRVSELSR